MPTSDKPELRGVRRAARAVEAFYAKPYEAGGLPADVFKMTVKQVNNTNSLVRTLARNNKISTIQDAKTNCDSARGIIKARIVELSQVRIGIV